MGATAGRALSKVIVRENIVRALDDWSTASTFSTDASDVANMANADFCTLNEELYVMKLQNRMLYRDSLEQLYVIELL